MQSGNSSWSGCNRGALGLATRETSARQRQYCLRQLAVLVHQSRGLHQTHTHVVKEVRPQNTYVSVRRELLCTALCSNAGRGESSSDGPDICTLQRAGASGGQTVHVGERGDSSWSEWSYFVYIYQAVYPAPILMYSHQVRDIIWSHIVHLLLHSNLRAFFSVHVNSTLLHSQT